MAIGIELVGIYTVSGPARLLSNVSSLAVWVLHALIVLHDTGDHVLRVSRRICCVCRLVCVAGELPYVSLVPCGHCTCSEVSQEV